MNKLPLHIAPCPIHEAVFEIRFDSDMPDDAIFGIVFNEFKDAYNNKATELASLQIPSFMRVNDPNLKFAPHYKMESECFLLQIGPKVISLSNINQYKGWDEFKHKIVKLFNQLKDINIFKNIHRISLRYINIFADMDIFEESSIQVLLENKPLNSNNVNLSTQIINGPIISAIKVISGAQIKLNQSNEINGSLIDIDSFNNFSSKESKDLLAENFVKRLDSIHHAEKELFYKILGQKYCTKLNPEY